MRYSLLFFFFLLATRALARSHAPSSRSYAVCTSLFLFFFRQFPRLETFPCPFVLFFLALVEVYVSWSCLCFAMGGGLDIMAVGVNR